jgi:hypothetical protein
VACKWGTSPDGSKFWWPDCWPGVIHGPNFCTCKPEKGKPDIEKRLKTLEKKFQKIEVKLNTYLKQIRKDQ